MLGAEVGKKSHSRAQYCVSGSASHANGREVVYNRVISPRETRFSAVTAVGTCGRLRVQRRRTRSAGRRAG